MNHPQMEGRSCCDWLKKHESLSRTLFILFLGQVISFIMAITSFSSSYLASRGVNAPITQSFFTYFGLTSIYGSIMLFRRKKLLVPWYYYVILGIVDVQGNYLVTKAFQFTSITSVTLFDCWTIPWVMILTWVFIGTRYTILQYIGAATCILGLGLVLLSDAGIGGGGGSRPLLGDFLVIGGTLFYALSNVGEVIEVKQKMIAKSSYTTMENKYLHVSVRVYGHTSFFCVTPTYSEFCVKKKDVVEVISMLGVFGLLVSICQIVLLERRNLEAIEWSMDVILGLAGYAVATCLFYTLVPFLLKLSGATLFNLSALTSDMWAVVIRILFYHERVDWLYYVSFAIVVVGLVIYSRSDTNPAPVATNVDGHPGVQYEVLGEECLESRDVALTA